jgi:hypothetical protein
MTTPKKRMNFYWNVDEMKIIYDAIEKTNFKKPQDPHWLSSLEGEFRSIGSQRNAQAIKIRFNNEKRNFLRKSKTGYLSSTFPLSALLPLQPPTSSLTTQPPLQPTLLPSPLLVAAPPPPQSTNIVVHKTDINLVPIQQYLEEMRQIEISDLDLVLKEVLRELKTKEFKVFVNNFNYK